ncbi:TRAP transport system, small permease protein [Afipia carboxidovorans OM5]|uniref:TRAP transporter small permease protein n=1 Tax=Afipia carboxidovorans (strain ATCC 49405 / DSM 1227 / KCTC 32145 / OM5) TaxID=504832 RepID=F8BYD9_AFIC5|nr:TRAP transporter small permease [Afipia carboxidovorans]AEI04044.1 TRAP transport system, small permease protein [Afipia carboxidovorans OM4]AEI07674.1 TRAP transport system, small permease protein [Afipia carboxidovorans OM5]
MKLKEGVRGKRTPHLGDETLMRHVQSIIFLVSRLSGILAGLLLVAMVGHIMVEIILRSFFGSSTYVLDEFVGYGVGAVTFLSLGYTLEHGELIRVNLLLSRLGARGRRFVELGASLTCLAVLTFISWFVFLRVFRHVSRGTVSSTLAEVPMWIPEGAILLGLSLFWIQMFAYFLRAATGSESDVGPLVRNPNAIQYE